MSISTSTIKKTLKVLKQRAYRRKENKKMTEKYQRIIKEKLSDKNNSILYKKIKKNMSFDKEKNKIN